MGLACVAGAAAVAAFLFEVSDVVFEGAFLYGEIASAGVVVEKDCEHDGLLLEMDLTALVAGLDTVLDAMISWLRCSA